MSAKGAFKLIESIPFADVAINETVSSKKEFLPNCNFALSKKRPASRLRGFRLLDCMIAWPEKFNVSLYKWSFCNCAVSTFTVAFISGYRLLTSAFKVYASRRLLSLIFPELTTTPFLKSAFINVL